MHIKDSFFTFLSFLDNLWKCVQTLLKVFRASPYFHWNVKIFFSLWVFYKVICCCEQTIIFVLSCRWNLIKQEFKNDYDNWSPNNSRTLLTLHHFLNTLILVIVIFTWKEEKDNKISFLDISISRNNNAREASIFRKPTFSGIYTNFNSFLPAKYKRGLILFTLFLYLIPLFFENLFKSFSHTNDNIAIPTLLSKDGNQGRKETYLD